MSQSTIIAGGIALACALSAAALPAYAGDKTAGPARWTTGDSTPAQRKATLTKEINAAYAEQKTQCQRQAAAKRANCLTAARTTYQHDLASMPRLLADAPAGGVSERVVSTTASAPATPDTPVGAGTNAVGGSGSTGTTGSGSTDAIPPAAAQSGGVPPPVDQPDPAQPTQPPQGVPPTQQQ